MKVLISLFPILLLIPSPSSQSLAVHSQSERKATSHRIADSGGGDYISGNKIVGTSPKGYEDLLVLWVDNVCICRNVDCEGTRKNLTPDSRGRIAVCGRIVFKGWRYPQGDSDFDGKYISYEFEEACLIDIWKKPIRLIFRTKKHDGTSYRFVGSYLDPPEESGSGIITHLKGKMIKLKHGKKVSETEIAFSPYQIIE